MTARCAKHPADCYDHRCAAHGFPIGWTDDQERTLRAMWAAGNSAGEIALAIGGVSRDAIKSKARRLGLSERGKP